jgi:hypothetical protein
LATPLEITPSRKVKPFVGAEAPELDKVLIASMLPTSNSKGCVVVTGPVVAVPLVPVLVLVWSKKPLVRRPEYSQTLATAPVGVPERVTVIEAEALAPTTPAQISTSRVAVLILL